MFKNLNALQSENVLKENFLGTLSFASGEQPFVGTMTYFFDAGSLLILGYSKMGPSSLSLKGPTRVSFGVSKNSEFKNYNYILLHGILTELKADEGKKAIKCFNQGIQKIIAKSESANLHFIIDLPQWIKTNKQQSIFRLQLNTVKGKEYIAQTNISYLPHSNELETTSVTGFGDR